MKRKRSPLAISAAVLVIVAGSYTLPAPGSCYNFPDTNYCRNALTSAPSDTATIGDEVCYLDSNSANDYLVGSTYYYTTGLPYCINDTTYCGVAYDCDSGIQFVGYICGPNGWFEIYEEPIPQNCQYCPVP